MWVRYEGVRLGELEVEGRIARIEAEGDTRLSISVLSVALLIAMSEHLYITEGQEGGESQSRTAMRFE